MLKNKLLVLAIAGLILAVGMIGTASAATYTYSGTFTSRTDGTNTNAIMYSSGSFSDLHYSSDSVSWNNKWTNNDNVDHDVSTPYSCFALSSGYSPTHYCAAFSDCPSSGAISNSVPLRPWTPATYGVNAWHNYGGSLNSDADTYMTFTVVGQ